MKKNHAWLYLAVLSIGCGSEALGALDSGVDGGRGGDAGADAESGEDAAVSDGGSIDGGSIDGGSIDGGAIDGGASDGGSIDGGSIDGGASDGGASDGGTLDGRSPDGGVMTDGGPLPVPCANNADCVAADFCAAVACGAEGTCAARPSGCPDVVDPVCGCDGVTYGNACEAAAAGVNVAMRGDCPATGCALTPSAGCCFEDGTCGSRSQRCVGETCVAGGEGTCVSNLLGVGRCWEDTDCNAGETCQGETLCGCGMLCLLPDAPGRCAPPVPIACTDNSACDRAQYCAKAAGDCSGAGECMVRPRICPLFVDPVCGCDGATYGNACEATAAGVNVASRGACGLACGLAPAASCCFDDMDCSSRDGRCVNEACRDGGEGTCVSALLGSGECWEDADCPRLGSCSGARICPCGAACLLPDEPGRCSSIAGAP